MNQTIFVSVIIPTFNRSVLLEETLLSVKNQSFTNWECLIVDDGSVDNTSQVINEFSDKDSRFKYYLRPSWHPKGASGCRNYGFEKSSGKYIQWLDDDDLLSENKLQLQVERLEKINNLRIFTTCDWDLYWLGKKGEFKNVFTNEEIIKANVFFDIIGKNQTFIPPVAYLISRKLARLAGKWNPHLSLNDDAEYFTRILLKSEGLVNTNGCFVLYREHSGKRLSKTKDLAALQSFLLSLKLMQTELDNYHINSKKYFKWKLLKIFHQYWKTNPEILKANFFFFKENDINLNFAKYYLLKYAIYKRLYPWYKRNIKKKTL